MNKKIRIIGAGVLLVLWAALTGLSWFLPAREFSMAERRQLEQFPTLNKETLLNGKFMEEFESYTLDQFPLRDTFRQIKALFHYNALQQMDNNGIYIVDGYAAEMEYPLDTKSLDHALEQYNLIYERFLKNSDTKVYTTVVPDKGYYLAKESGHLAMDYEAMFATVRAKTPWAAWLGVEDYLSLEDYYYTDTHWRQEKILEAVQMLANGMGVDAPKAEDFRAEAMERPFYGVYYGQAALPMNPETMYLMHSDILDGCTVYNHETKQTTPIYDPAMLEDKDQYNIYLSGPQSLLTITNPNATTDRELIIFRDSFGSSFAPLLMHSYKSITLVDIRYFRNIFALGMFIKFDKQDVLFMYSSLVLNKNLI